MTNPKKNPSKQGRKAKAPPNPVVNVPNPKAKSRDWFTDRRIAVASLAISIISAVVSFFGGVPGILSFINFRKSVPILIFEPTLSAHLSFNVATAGSVPDVYNGIFLSGVLSNNGTETLSPVLFDLEGFIDESWYRFDRTLMPTLDRMESKMDDTNRTIIIENPASRDLHRFIGVIPFKQKIQGHFFFTTKKYTVEGLTKVWGFPMKLVCKDVTGMKYSTQIIQIKEKLDDNNQIFPGLGIYISPKN